eukprot:11211494-Heterocapsa_arctica.AAC.1
MDPARIELELLKRSRLMRQDRLVPLEQSLAGGVPVLVLKNRQYAGTDRVSVVQKVGVDDEQVEREGRSIQIDVYVLFDAETQRTHHAGE